MNNYLSHRLLTTRDATRNKRYIFHISYEQLCHCLRLGFNWQGIASLFGIDRRTLFQHRQRHGIGPLEFAELSNYELNTVVRQILQRTPNAGETYILGSLRSRSIRIQRWRVRQSLHEIDPIGKSLRRRRAVRRRIYSVQTPNQLWHIDGNHKTGQMEAGFPRVR